MIDHLGLPVTTTRDSLSQWEIAVGSLVSLEADTIQQFDRLLAIDPDFALARAARGVALVAVGREDEARQDLSAAIAAVRQASPRERSAVAGLVRHITGDLAAAAAILVRHLSEFPTDLVVGQFAVAALSSSGLSSDSDAAALLMESQWQRFPDDAGWLSLVAFTLSEDDRYDDARRLADRALSLEPKSSHAAHALAHCNYETGEHEAGGAWLSQWLSTYSTLCYGTHFAWHIATHELALGNVAGVLDRCRAAFRPKDFAEIGSLLWRLRLANIDYDHSLASESAELVHLDATASTAFAGFNAVLIHACAQRGGAVRGIARQAAHDSRPAFSGVLAPVAAGIAELVEGNPAKAAATLIPTLPYAGSLGGSNLQREIVEDTLIRALIEAGRTDDARSMLQRRQQRGHRPANVYELMIARASDASADGPAPDVGQESSTSMPNSRTAIAARATT